MVEPPQRRVWVSVQLRSGCLLRFPGLAGHDLTEHQMKILAFNGALTTPTVREYGRGVLEKFCCARF